MKARVYDKADKHLIETLTGRFDAGVFEYTRGRFRRTHYKIQIDYMQTFTEDKDRIATLYYDGHDYIQFDPFKTFESLEKDKRTAEDFIQDYVRAQYEQEAMLRKPTNWQNKVSWIVLIAALGILLVVAYTNSGNTAVVKQMYIPLNHSVNVNAQLLHLLLNRTANLTKGIP
ncbi:MAG: hypothetical protein QXL94_06635 [Candidatus Parvarchaeum sp.]